MRTAPRHAAVRAGQNPAAAGGSKNGAHVPVQRAVRDRRTKSGDDGKSEVGTSEYYSVYRYLFTAGSSMLSLVITVKPVPMLEGTELPVSTAWAAITPK